MKNYIDTIENFLKTSQEDILKQIKSYNQDAEESQIKSWKKIIEDLKNSSFLKSLNSNLIIALEYQLGVENMAADIILAGYDLKKKKNVLIIEVKEWNDEYIYATSFSNYREKERQLHPQIQVTRHKTAFQNYLNIGPNYNVEGVVLINNVTNSGIMKLIEKNQNTNSKHVPCYNNLDTLLENYSNTFNYGTDEIQNDLTNAFYKPARDVIEAMNDIVKNEEGFILTDEQQEAMKKIIFSMETGKKIIQVDGCAGSGKTAILINLYVALLRNHKFENKNILFCSGAQNTALYRSLYPVGEQLFGYSFNLIKKIENWNQDYIIILDEAQHNEKGVISALLKENVTLILAYDKQQAIIAMNAVEELEKLEDNPNYCQICLNKTVRFNNSEHFISNVKKLLNGDKNSIEDDKFDFKVLSNIQEVSDKAREIISSNPNDTFATIGLLSNDHKKIEEFINHKDSIFFTHWNFKEECKWIPYINSKNYFKQNNGKLWVGTWWMPGLDVDYVLVIVGSDAKLTKEGIKAIPDKMAEYNMVISVAKKLNFFADVAVYKNGYQKKLDNPNTTKKIMDYVSNNSQIKKDFERELNLLIWNNYYVMLTRARKGCYVYFMNDETKDPS